jgi:hypothetical protein
MWDYCFKPVLQQWNMQMQTGCCGFLFCYFLFKSIIINDFLRLNLVASGHAVRIRLNREIKLRQPTQRLPENSFRASITVGVCKHPEEIYKSRNVC